jgi:hypothetical protein
LLITISERRQAKDSELWNKCRDLVKYIYKLQSIIIVIRNSSS